MRKGEFFCCNECIIEFDTKYQNEKYYKEFPFIDKHTIDGLVVEDDIPKLYNNYVIVCATECNEYCAHGFGSIGQVRKWIINDYRYSEDSGWYILAVYSMLEKRKMEYTVDVVVDFDFELNRRTKDKELKDRLFNHAINTAFDNWRSEHRNEQIKVNTSGGGGIYQKIGESNWSEIWDSDYHGKTVREIIIEEAW